MDGHGNHLTSLFNEICTENFIVPLCMPPHSSHLLQPLDVGSFARWSNLTKTELKTKWKNGVRLINKLKFLEVYFPARHVAFTQSDSEEFCHRRYRAVQSLRVLSKLTQKPHSWTGRYEYFRSTHPQISQRVSATKRSYTRCRSFGADDSKDSVMSLIDQAFKAARPSRLNATFYRRKIRGFFHVEESRKEKKVTCPKTTQEHDVCLEWRCARAFSGLFQLPASRGNLPMSRLLDSLDPRKATTEVWRLQGSRK